MQHQALYCFINLESAAPSSTTHVSNMSRGLRRCITALCAVSTVLIICWAGSGERVYLESAQYRVVRTNVVERQSGSEIGKTDFSDIASASKKNKRDDRHSVRQLHFIHFNESNPGLLSSRSQGGPPIGDGNQPRAKVLLMSYMRSGSTFTGDIFQSLPEVFYLYEPLLYVNDDDYMGPRERMIRARLIPKAMGIPDPPEIRQFTLDMLNCRLSDHNLRFLYGLSYSKSTTGFDACQKKLGVKPSKFGECGQQLKNRCEQSRAVVSKILRLKMWEVEKLLAEDKDLKVIHLVRDPRGVSVSRGAVRYQFAESSFCNRLNRDSQLSAELQVRYPNRTLTVRYEDLAANALQIAKMMFNFSGISWTQTVEKSIEIMTANSDFHTKEHFFNTKRKNSSQTAFHWRRKIPFQTALRLQKLCQMSMEVYGYIAVTSEQELRDQSVSSLSQDYSDKFYKAQILR
ncbi:carbohydrate sulfotransferase [Plakobranchus ocellatus]|uniref:Carbohydrate sulfotransferase n=1 Tax=Plakobranchus ocellatus TaxID=259542 RepID=A0AAV4DKL6_9GAST|nr:carbohydrate sulfotransferase [Plakobranchus ocellatus]